MEPEQVDRLMDSAAVVLVVSVLVTLVSVAVLALVTSLWLIFQL